MYRFLALLAFFGLSTAVASHIIRIPNSKVSYYYSKDPIHDANDSSIFIDGVSTRSYVELVCLKGRMRFFLTSQNDFLNQDDYNRKIAPKMHFRVDNEPFKVIHTLTVVANRDLAAGHHLRSLAVPDAQDAQLFSAFARAKYRVAIRIQRRDGVKPTDIFLVSGFGLAYQGIRRCQ